MPAGFAGGESLGIQSPNGGACTSLMAGPGSISISSCPPAV
jgi:hypothetical protein